MGVFSGTLCQCDFGAVYLKPTRLLTNVPLARNLLVVGTPQIDEQGNYLGPLQKRLTGARDDRESIRVFRNPRV